MKHHRRYRRQSCLVRRPLRLQPGGDQSPSSNRTVKVGTMGRTDKTYTKPSRSDHRTRMPPPEVLRSPHLMLSDTGGDDHVLLVRRGLLVEFFDNLLRLHLLSIFRLAF